MNWIDLNADLGEGTGNDAQMMAYISSANIACGGHAGDEHTMRNAMNLALEHNVAIGAHPGFEDKQNFGRLPLQLSPDIWRTQILRQLERFENIALSLGMRMQYVKLHGAMANMTAADPGLAGIAFKAVKEFRKDMIMLTIANSAQSRIADQLSMPHIEEAFADRAYTDDGLLASRHLSGAVLEDENDVLQHVARLITKGEVETISGKMIKMQASSICLHGDNAHALDLARSIVAKIKSFNCEIKSFAHKN